MISKDYAKGILERLKRATDGNEDAVIAIDDWYSLAVTHNERRYTIELTYADFTLGEVRIVTVNDDYLVILMPDDVSFTMKVI